MTCEDCGFEDHRIEFVEKLNNHIYDWVQVQKSLPKDIFSYLKKRAIEEHIKYIVILRGHQLEYINRGPAELIL